jgi:hypothetical protein
MLAVDTGEPEVTKMSELQYTDERHLDAGSDSGNLSQTTFLSMEVEGTREKEVLDDWTIPENRK